MALGVSLHAYLAFEFPGDPGPNRDREAQTIRENLAAIVQRAIERGDVLDGIDGRLVRTDVRTCRMRGAV